MPDPTPRAIAFTGEIHLDVPDGCLLHVGLTFPVIRGGGPRDGERCGTGTITGFAEDGSPEWDMSIGEGHDDD